MYVYVYTHRTCSKFKKASKIPSRTWQLLQVATVTCTCFYVIFMFFPHRNLPFAPRRPAKREAKRRPATAYSKRQTVACSSLVGREFSLSMSTWSTWSTWHDFGRLLRSFMTQTSVIRKLRTSFAQEEAYQICQRQCDVRPKDVK